MEAEHSQHYMEETPTQEERHIPVESEKPRLDLSRLILPVSIIIAALIVSGTLLYVQGNKGGGDQNPSEKVDVSADDDPVLGKAKAKVTIIEFSDFQCPFCRAFWEDTLPELKREYIDTGKAKLVYRDFPLSFHDSAKPAAHAAQCANEQGKFWEMHDKMFEGQAARGSGTIQFSKTDITSWAKEAGLEMNAFNSCMDSNRYEAEIDKDTQDGSAAGVDGTPTFFINGRRLVGAQPFSQFKLLIDQEL